MNPTQEGAQPEQMTQEQFVQQLKMTLERLPNQIPLFLFTLPGQDDVFVQAARQLVRSFRELTDKIVFREYSLDHEMARKHRVDQAPTLLFAPERYSIRWLGAPLGEEGRTFLEMIILLGLGQSNLNDQAKKVLEGLQEPRHVKVFVSATCPYCPQQAVNAVRAAIEKPDLVSLEIIDIQSNPELANRYNAHSVPQTFTNEVLTGMGAQTEELFMLSMIKLEAVTIFIPDSDAPVVDTDLLIVGGGPAGLTAGIYAVRSGLKAAVVERGALGGQVATTPVVENYPGLTQVGGKSLVDIMVSHALQYVQIFQGEAVMDIQSGDPIEITTSRRKFRSKAVLLATGASHKHLGVPGESRLAGKGVSYCSTCDGPLFKGKKVIMIGGGNSAVTEALHLHHMGVDVTLVHRRDALRAQQYLVTNLEENRIPVLWNSEIKEIRGKDRVEEVLLLNNRSKKTTTLKIDGVFLAIGYQPAVELAHKIGVTLTADGYIQRDAKHRTSIRGIYSAGDVEGGYKQIVTAAGQGSEAALAIFEDMMHPYWEKAKAQA